MLGRNNQADLVPVNVDDLQTLLLDGQLGQSEIGDVLHHGLHHARAVGAIHQEPDCREKALVFAEYKSLFPAVGLLVDRSYGSRVVEAVMENIADFGLTQLPVEEKRLQVVNVHRDEIRLIVPAKHPLSAKSSVTCQDLTVYPLLLPKSGVTRTRLNAWFEPVEDDIQ